MIPQKSKLIQSVTFCCRSWHDSLITPPKLELLLPPIPARWRFYVLVRHRLFASSLVATLCGDVNNFVASVSTMICTSDSDKNGSYSTILEPPNWNTCPLLLDILQQNPRILQIDRMGNEKSGLTLLYLKFGACNQSQQSASE